MVQSVHGLVADREIHFNTIVINPSRSNYVLFTFCMLLKFMFLPATKAWRDNKMSGYVFPNHSQAHSLSFSPRFVNLNVTHLLIGKTVWFS